MPGEVTSGLFVLAGAILVYVANGVSAWWQKKADQKKVLREKFEELCAYLSESFSDAHQIARAKRVEDFSIVPMRATFRAHSLAMIYFPKLINDVKQLSRDFDRFVESTTDLHSPSNQYSEQQIRDSTEDLYRLFLYSRVGLEQAINEHSDYYVRF